MKKNDPISYEWRMQLKIATNGNKYDDAPEFEAFMQKTLTLEHRFQKHLNGVYSFT
jgi:hypothetical protein